MSKIIGNTVGMGLPKPNLMQTDPTKGDYVKGKEEFLAQAGSGSGQNDYVLPVGGDELGGVKNGGNVVINADGTMTAPVGSSGNSELPDYVNVEINRIARRLRKHMRRNNPIIIGVSTDQHTSYEGKNGNGWDGAVFRGLKALEELTKLIPFNLIALCGDSGTGDEAQGIVSYVSGCVANADCKVVHIPGNHDTFHGAEDTLASIYASHFKLSVLRGDVVVPDEAGVSCNGYFDDPTCKVRFIFVDDNNYLNNGELREAALTTMLDTVPEGYKVIFFSHHPWFIASAICSIHGHNHADNVEVSEDGAIRIGTTCAGNPALARDGYTRTLGTATETAFDVYVIDQDENIAYIERYGVGFNRIFKLDTGEQLYEYTVAAYMANSTVDNNPRALRSDKTYTATVTGDTANIIVMMNGEDVTADVYNNGVINIETLTGDVVILDETGVDCSNNLVSSALDTISNGVLDGVGYKDGYQTSSTHPYYRGSSTSNMLGRIPCKNGDTIYVYGTDVASLACFNADGQFFYNNSNVITELDTNYYKVDIVGNNVAYVCLNTSRTSFANAIVTVNNPIKSSDGGDTEVTLSSISATYNGGEVVAGTAVSDLTGIVVKAHYSDGSTETVTGYTLSGTIAEGSNTVTVSYGGKTTTFNVTGVAESGGDTHTHSHTSAVTTEATCTTAGVITYTCSCGDTYTEEIPATGHNYVDGVCTICGASDPSHEETASLPDGYTQLDYIVVTGGAAAKTGVYPTANTHAEYKMALVEQPTVNIYGNVLGNTVRGKEAAYTFPYLTVNSSGSKQRVYYGRSGNAETYKAYAYSLDTPYVLKGFPDGCVLINDEVVATDVSAGTTPGTYELHYNGAPGVHSDGSVSIGASSGHHKMYYMKIWESDELIRHYIPAKNADGVAGLYDVINNTFMVSETTEAFTAPA